MLTMWRSGPFPLRPGPAGDATRSTILDSGSLRRNAVMCALRRISGVTHGYQSDSSSKTPASSAFQDALGGLDPPNPHPSPRTGIGGLTTGRSISVSGRPWVIEPATAGQPEAPKRMKVGCLNPENRIGPVVRVGRRSPRGQA